jgi:GDP-4-dehydro-6-deoxy-D-mannose reductase
VLVIGWDGFLGHHFQKFVVHNRLDEKYEFVGVSRHPRIGTFWGVSADVLDAERLADVFKYEHPDYVLNLAGNTDRQFDSVYLAGNPLLASRHVVTPRTLHVGSAAEYGIPPSLPVTEDANASPNPVTPYGQAKLVQTITALYLGHQFNIPVFVARPFNIIGKGQPATFVVGSFVQQVNAAPDGGTIEVGNLETQRDFLAADDVAAALWTILTKGKAGEIYNVCSGVPTRVGDMLDYLIERSGKRLQVVSREDRLRKDVPVIYGDNSKLRALGWSQTMDWRNALRQM